MLAALEAKTTVDLISLDQIWLGEFAQKGLLTDLTNYTKNWGRQNDWYQAELGWRYIQWKGLWNMGMD